MRYLLLSLLFMPISGFGQTEIFVKGKILDAKTKQPLPRASIYDVREQSFHYTNDNGIFSFKSVPPVELTISYIGYENKVFRLKKSNTDTVLIELQPTEIGLSGVEVLPQLPEHLFFGSKETEVIDYEFMGENTLIALFNYFKKQCFLVILDKDNQIIAEQPFPADFEKFHKSCIDKYYAITPSVVYEILLQNSAIEAKPVSEKFFYKKVMLYTAWHDHYYYISELADTKQWIIFYYEDIRKIGNSEYYPFTSVFNGKEARWSRELRDTIEKEDDAFDAPDITLTSLKRNRNEFKHKALYKEMYLDKPIYAPLFVNDSNVLIFDFYKHTLLKFSFDTHSRDTISILFHRIGGWQPWVYQNGNHYFTRYENENAKCTLTELDKKTWHPANNFTLFYPHSSNYKVRGDYVYYLHQPHEKLNNVFLFREKWD